MARETRRTGTRALAPTRAHVTECHPAPDPISRCRFRAVDSHGHRPADDARITRFRGCPHLAFSSRWRRRPEAAAVTWTARLPRVLAPLAVCRGRGARG